MIRKVIRFIAAALLLLGLAACRDSNPIQGYVVGKRHIPLRTVITYNPTLHIHQTHIIPERYVVWIADSIAVHKCPVNRATFHRLTKGEYVTQKGFQYGTEESK